MFGVGTTDVRVEVPYQDRGLHPRWPSMLTVRLFVFSPRFWGECIRPFCFWVCFRYICFCLSRRLFFGRLVVVLTCGRGSFGHGVHVWRVLTWRARCLSVSVFLFVCVLSGELLAAIHAVGDGAASDYGGRPRGVSGEAGPLEFRKATVE